MCRLSGRYQQYALSGLGEGYVKDFIDRGRVKRVYMQGDAAWRQHRFSDGSDVRPGQLSEQV